ncbi:unnamed protein product [Clonostachys solani]|uniref:Uncharacterized protein n=1 Tax=Clonostachys solani TaxID=160281 RepID=A0A9N9ZKA6_9HYPO|nr:unnamed protein product [Clonostachys solani]
MRSSMDEIMRRMATLSVNLLQFIGKSSSYQWHFKWAPTYSALMLTFLAMLAFQISEKSPDLINRAILVVQVAPITRMLQSYPHTQRLASHLEQITQSFEFGVTGDMADESNDRVISQDQSQTLLQSEGPAEMFTFDYENLDLFLAPGYMDNFSID